MGSEMCIRDSCYTVSGDGIEPGIYSQQPKQTSSDLNPEKYHTFHRLCSEREKSNLCPTITPLPSQPPLSMKYYWNQLSSAITDNTGLSSTAYTSAGVCWRIVRKSTSDLRCSTNNGLYGLRALHDEERQPAAHLTSWGLRAARLSISETPALKCYCITENNSNKF